MEDMKSKTEIDLFSNCKWIWLKQLGDDVNQWVDIRRTFVLDNIDKDASIYLSIDTDYGLWINGQLVDLGQFSDFPRQKHYDILNVHQFLKEGTNCIAILGFYQGENTSRYAKGKPGLIFALHNNQEVIKSDQNCRIRKSPGYHSGPIPSVTQQLGLTIEYNAAKDDNWTAVDYDDSQWHMADEIALPTEGYWNELKPRPLPKVLLSQIDAGIIDYGQIKRNVTSDISVAHTMSQDTLVPASELQKKSASDELTLLPDRSYEGGFVISDLGKESFGYFEMELTAPQGTVVDIAHGEHLLDGKVRCRIEERNFADRYICKDGRQKWLMPARRLGCRYLQLHFTNFSEPVHIHRIGLRKASYPIDINGKFQCSSQLHNDIHQLCLNTLELCMHEHYEDCPWREQALYSSDARIQALCGYYIFGEYDFPEESLRLLGNSICSDGFLALCAPMTRSLTIPSYSMIWIVALWEHCLHSGRDTLCTEFSDQIDFMLKKYISLYNEKSLMTSLTGEDYWNFYEWTTSLNGSDDQGIRCDTDSEKVESCLNLFLLEAFDAAGNIYEFIGQKERSSYYISKAAELRKTLSSEYTPEGLPVTIQPAEKKNMYSQLIESLAMITGVLDENMNSEISKKIAFSDSLEKATLCNLLYVYRATMSQESLCKEFVFQDIAEKWGFMLDNDATSCWETIKGAEDFNGAGSLCHGWSTVPIYFYYAHILGIKPLRPGFKEFSVNPSLEHFDHASGHVPTPYGRIFVEWNSIDKKFTLKYPNTIKPRILKQLENWTLNIEAY